MGTKVKAHFWNLPAALTAAAGLALPTAAQADVLHWIGPSENGIWHDAANWEERENDDVVTSPAWIPTASDDVRLENAIVEINAAATYNDNSGGGGTANINDGGTLTPTGGWNNVIRGFSVIVNNGGELNLLNASNRVNIRSTVTVNAGGTMLGGGQNSATLSVGGHWVPDEWIWPNESGAFHASADLTLTSTGTLELALFDNGLNRHIHVGSASAEIDLAAGSILLAPQGDYEPEIGDSFTLWTNPDENPNVTVGDGSNIALPGYALDVSQFQSEGIVTVIPEPGSLMLLGLGGALMLVRRRRW